MESDFEIDQDFLLKELEVVKIRMKRDINTDDAIEQNIENFLERHPQLINTIIQFYESCEIFELQVKLATVILDHIEYKPAFDVLVKSGRTPTWLFENYSSVEEMLKKGIIKIKS